MSESNLAIVQTAFPLGARFNPRMPWATHPLVPLSESEKDHLTGNFRLCLGLIPSIQHRDYDSSQLPNVWAEASLPPVGVVQQYRTKPEYDELLHEPTPTVFQHAHDADAVPLDRYAIPRQTLIRLNDKAQLTELIPTPYRPHRLQVNGPNEIIIACRSLGWRVVMKLSSENSLNGGDGVRICWTEAECRLAVDLLAAFGPVILETLYSYVRNWCAGGVIDIQGVVTYLGASEQEVSPAGEHLANFITSTEQPQELSNLIKLCGEEAARYGYIGVFGVDVLELDDGRLAAIDLNFRFNSSTPMLLLRSWFGCDFASMREWHIDPDLSEIDLERRLMRDARDLVSVPLSLRKSQVGVTIIRTVELSSQPIKTKSGFATRQLLAS